MGKTKLFMMIVFVLAAASGVVAGMLITRLPGGGTAEAASRTPLAEELQLTAQQTQQMRDIWEGVRGKVDDCFVRAQEAQKKRDEALLALLTDEQKTKLAKAQAECASTMAALKADRDAAFQEAVKRTEQILTEPQKQRYREILKSRLGGGGGAAPDWLTPARPGLPQ